MALLYQDSIAVRLSCSELPVSEWKKPLFLGFDSICVERGKSPRLSDWCQPKAAPERCEGPVCAACAKPVSTTTSVFLTRPTLSPLTQVHDLHLYGSTVDSALRDSTWEIQTYVHFQDHDGITVVIKPEHRVEDVLTLACKVMGFAVGIYTSQQRGAVMHSWLLVSWGV